jgi:hypothetical protein
MKTVEWFNLITKIAFWVGTLVMWFVKWEIAAVMTVFVVADMFIIRRDIKREKLQQQIQRLHSRSHQGLEPPRKPVGYDERQDSSWDWNK